MRVPNRVTLVEVGPRDGLQSLERVYSIDVKVEMIRLLAETGLSKIEVTSFARPDVIPQLADADEVVARLPRHAGVRYRALVPNRYGAMRAIACGVDEIVGLITASETYNMKNSNMSVADNLTEIRRIARMAEQGNVSFVMAVGLAMFCPYEGEIPERKVLRIIERIQGEGIEELYVASSAGLDGPRQVHRLCSRVLERWPGLRLGVHLHNTNGLALANALAACDAGVTWFEGAICGIGGGIRLPGGMPHCGNVATEDLAHMFHEMGVETGIEFRRLLASASAIRELLGLERVESYALRGGTKENVRECAARAMEEAGD